MNKARFLPVYNVVFFRKKLLLEKFFKKNEDLIWDNHFILEFKPFGKKSSNFLIKSAGSGFPVELVHWNKEYCAFKINIIENIGDTDGGDFINWIKNFYNEKNNYYKFNIYDENSADINIYAITKTMKKLVKYQLMSCVIKEPFFYVLNKNDSSPQLSVTICTKNQASINRFVVNDDN